MHREGPTHKPDASALVAAQRHIDALAEILDLGQAPLLPPSPDRLDGHQGGRSAAAAARGVAPEPGVVDGPRGAGEGQARQAVVFARGRALNDAAGPQDARHDGRVDGGDGVPAASVARGAGTVAGEMVRLRAARERNPRNRHSVLDGHSAAREQPGGCRGRWVPQLEPVAPSVQRVLLPRRHLERSRPRRWRQAWVVVLGQPVNVEHALLGQPYHREVVLLVFRLHGEAERGHHVAKRLERDAIDSAAAVSCAGRQREEIWLLSVNTHCLAGSAILASR